MRDDDDCGLDLRAEVRADAAAARVAKGDRPQVLTPGRCLGCGKNISQARDRNLRCRACRQAKP